MKKIQVIENGWTRYKVECPVSDCSRCGQKVLEGWYMIQSVPGSVGVVSVILCISCKEN